MPSNRGGFIGHNPLLLPSAPTGVSGSLSGSDVNVSFTSPGTENNISPSSFIVYATTGSTTTTATGSSSPITVSGLTGGSSYTFKVAAVNGLGTGPQSSASAAVTVPNIGQTAYTSAGTYTFTVPAGVSSVSVVCIGSGGGAGGAGQSAGSPGNASIWDNGNTHGSYFGASGAGNGGSSTNIGGSTNLGTSTGGGNGGDGSSSSNLNPTGGGAAGYSGDGGDASSPTVYGGGGGGGVGELGEGASGAGGSSPSYTGGSGSGGGGGGGAAYDSSYGGNVEGRGGSGGQNAISSGNGGNYGGGSGGGTGGGKGGGGGALRYRNNISVTAGDQYTVIVGQKGSSARSGGVGAVRIIYPGDTRSFPSTDTGNL